MQDSEMVGFPQLKDCGAFELLRTAQNCRQLDVINCRDWSVKELHWMWQYVHITSQLKKTSQLNLRLLMKVNCTGCGNTFTLRDLRKHTALCEGAFLMESDSDSDVSLPPSRLLIIKMYLSLIVLAAHPQFNCKMSKGIPWVMFLF